MGLVKFLQGQDINEVNTIQPGAFLFDQSTGDLYIDVGNKGAKAIIGNYLGENINNNTENTGLANRICLTKHIINEKQTNFSIIDGGNATSVIDDTQETYMIFDGGKA